MAAVDALTVAQLLAGALDHVWDSIQEEAGSECCERCCPPCAAVQRLDAAGLLDEVLLDEVADGQDVWAADAGRGVEPMLLVRARARRCRYCAPATAGVLLDERATT